MASTYNIEPPPKGACILHTTTGDIHLELFAQQTPLTCRNFLQLILDGYYDNTIFHRLVPGFVFQGGDPTGTGSGGESSYPGGSPFVDEFHSRLKFNRRGLLGMANSGGKDENGSQFFLTLGPTEELTGKNTMFGRVVGNTIFNVVKIGEAELAEGEGSERPLYPTRITGAEVLENPFEGMLSRLGVASTTKEEGERPRKRQKKKGGKSMMSFADDEGEEEDIVPVKKSAKFNHTLVIANELSMPVAIETTKVQSKRRRSSPAPQKAAPTEPTSATSLPKEDMEAEFSGETSEPPEEKPPTNLLDRTNAKIADLKSSLRRNHFGAPLEKAQKKSGLEAMIPKNASKGRKRGAVSARDEAQAVDAFNAFRQKLQKNRTEVKAPQTHSNHIEGASDGVENKNGSRNDADDDEAALCDLHFISNCQSCNNWDRQQNDAGGVEEEGDTGWMAHSLSFAKDRLGKDLEWKRKMNEELVVIDPREKVKEIKHKRERDRGNDYGKDHGGRQE